MQFTRLDIERRHRRGRICVAGETFACTLETDWSSHHRGVYPRWLRVLGVNMAHVKFGFADAWDYTLDLDAAQADAGLVVAAQGYEKIVGGRVPFLRSRRFFWREPEMLHEVCELQHVHPRRYVIAGIEPGSLAVDALLRQATYQRDGVTLCWQFHPAPVVARPQSGPRGWGWYFVFESSSIEALLQWRQGEGEFRTFTSITDEVSELAVSGPRGRRRLHATCKHDCVEPDERLELPEGEVIFTGSDGTSTLAELAVRRIDGDEVRLGATRVFMLESLAESADFPMFKPLLIRSLRSLRERMVFGAVPEDDPGEHYQWGTGTWARCLTVLSLDRWGFSREAFDYLQFMLDASQQFVACDGDPHLWDNFYITGPKLNERLRDINAHAMKLYEAGKFYLAHCDDAFGESLRDEHFETLRRWCVWIDRHMEGDGAVRDETESNTWAEGFGTFTQAPAAAGVKLFTRIARDAGREDVAAHCDAVVRKLMHGLNTRLWGDAANRFWDIPEGAGACYLSYLPQSRDTRNWWDQPVERIGLSCYSLAAPYFLQDPDVALLGPDDERCAATIDLVLRFGGDPIDARITSWHIRRGEPHMGYGPGQMLQSLAWTGRGEPLRATLAGLFDVVRRDVGDPYLMQEVLGRSGLPNRGNKSAVSYFPYLAATLAGLDTAGNSEAAQACIPDLVLRRSGLPPSNDNRLDGYDRQSSARATDSYHSPKVSAP